jgi:hypothetical protein
MARRVLGAGYTAALGFAVSLGIMVGDGGVVLAASAAGALPATYASRAAEAMCRRKFLRERGQVPAHRIVVRDSDESLSG